MDRIHFDILIALVELDASGYTRIVLGCGKSVPNRLRVFGAAFNDVSDQHNLIIGVGIKVRRVGIELCFEVLDEIAHDRALLGWIELNNPNIANRCFASFLFKAKRQPNGAQLDGFTATTFDNAGLGQSLGDLRPWPSSV